MPYNPKISQGTLFNSHQAIHQTCDKNKEQKGGTEQISHLHSDIIICSLGTNLNLELAQGHLKAPGFNLFQGTHWELQVFLLLENVGQLNAMVDLFKHHLSLPPKKVPPHFLKVVPFPLGPSFIFCCKVKKIVAQNFVGLFAINLL